MTSRREFVRAGLLAGGSLALGPAFYTNAFAAVAGTGTPGPGPYGVPSVTSPLGITLPAGFTVREIARGGQTVAGTAYRWHTATDGQAAFAAKDGGWVLVSNSEAPPANGGGCSAIRFDASGTIVDAYRTLGGTNLNCAGGPTPWGTWLSGEEYEQGKLWEVDPTRNSKVKHDALGTFTHESACVDPVREQIYLTEDQPDGCFYRFTPNAYPDLAKGGRLEAAVVNDATGAVRWVHVDPAPTGFLFWTTSVRAQARSRGAKRFNGGEGTWWDGGIAYFTTKGDNRVWAYDCATERIEVLYDAAATGPQAPLTGVDNICVARSGDIYVCEDGGSLDLCLITPNRVVARFASFDQTIHRSTELVGVTFDPSGTRMYLGSQRSFGQGALYEISGPFNLPPSSTTPPSFGWPLDAGRVEINAEPLMNVRVYSSFKRADFKANARGLGVRIALAQTCEVTAEVRDGSGRVVASRGFVSAVTGLTALRLCPSEAAPPAGLYHVSVTARPLAGGSAITATSPLTLI